ncbi:MULTISPECIES: iron-containing alcohol dehydrogenase [unclassified Pseudomonas]|uniref:iron-containing alcohol dehydrogenase n=1 Tax=unclassified Pseudomonas TaxID=196821 RepID=UPI000C86B40D|nr:MULTISPECIES: iron-containing alcohol dehydrogenase [unclassified Pseudomonas]PMU22501.1 NADH-dependent alcohol dehydrogenase [Pseudomonas sp. GP01-A9]PMU27817.1 NADH-dependent alcohol dehydrogenase [Pseudomonas sp. GP01-A13]PMU37271.1 NADH-dependent alcohol dehydrogenase [Pseudomonas sp. GP01-A8]PMU51205.1 NADH-dependent alcohol dehydrogenase [Pseudomonas sp. GP01-A14]PMU51889.1 NADH-dependent alcohol dehydrogenase [Pseudomonas sp. GP01-A6]
MFNFDFYNPTRIVFGPDTIARLDDLVPTDARVMVLFGGQSARKTGTLAQVNEALGARHVQEFGGIEPNPSYETLMQAVAQVREQQLDFLLAVGGGSVIDGTKFVAAAVGYEGDAWNILETRGAGIRQALPFANVLTLPATGSEMNHNGEVTRRATQAKLPFRSVHVFPQFSILDPSKTQTLPVRQLANGVVDAFVHVMEQYLTYPVDARVQDRFAEGLLQTLIEIGPQILKESADYSTRANLMWTATLALNGLIGAGVPQDWSTHMIGHELTALHGIDHARTLAIVLPANLEVRREAKRAKLLQYAERVWHISQGNDEQRIDAAIQKTRTFFESLGLPTRLAAYQLDADDIDGLLKQLDAHRLTALGEHSNVTLDVSRQILEASL